MTFYQLQEAYFEPLEGETRRHLSQNILSATYNGDLDAVRAAVREDPTSVNVQHELTGATPLHLACSMGRYSIVEFLLSCEEIDLEVVDGDNLIPLEKAMMCGHPGVITIVKLKQFPHLWDMGYRGEGVEPGPDLTHDPSWTEEAIMVQAARAAAVLSRFAVGGDGPASDDEPLPPPAPAGP